MSDLSFTKVSRNSLWRFSMLILSFWEFFECWLSQKPHGSHRSSLPSCNHRSSDRLSSCLHSMLSHSHNEKRVGTLPLTKPHTVQSSIVIPLICFFVAESNPGYPFHLIVFPPCLLCLCQFFSLSLIFMILRVLRGLVRYFVEYPAIYWTFFLRLDWAYGFGKNPSHLITLEWGCTCYRDLLLVMSTLITRPR